MSKSKKTVTIIPYDNFTLTCTKNPDQSVLCEWALKTPTPSGMIIKYMHLVKFDANGQWLGSPWGLGPNQFENLPDDPYYSSSFLDKGAVGSVPGSVGTIQYILYAFYGTPGDPTSSNPGGSNVVSVSL